MVQITDEEYHKATNCKKGLEELLTKVCALAVEDALRVLPSVMQSLITQIADLKATSDKFYKDNPELVDCKDQVARVLEKLQSASPGKAYIDLLVDVKKELSLSAGFKPTIDHKPTLDEADYALKMFEE